MKRSLPQFATFFAFALTLSALSTLTFAQDNEKRLDAIFSKWNNATPGLVVGVTQDTSFIYKKAFGIADLEHATPVSTESIFESGSVAKQFTAMSILLLEAEGKLARPDDVRKYVPELPRYQVPITIQMLLNHTSGLKDWGSIGALTGWPRTTRVYTQELALQIITKQQSTNFTPGTEYSYSNSNYTLLVTIVERVSGMTLANFTDKRLFKPLQMNHTQWRNNFREVIPSRAIAYQLVNGKYEQLMPFENVHGHGGLLTTVDDLLKWNKLLKTQSVGGDEVYRARIIQGKLTNGKTISYASGLQIGHHNKYIEISHSGSTAGYRAWLAYYPEKRLSVVLLSNDATFAPASIGHEVAAVFLGEIEKPANVKRINTTIPKNTLQKYDGYYKSVRHFMVRKVTTSVEGLMWDTVQFNPVYKDSLASSKMKLHLVKPGKITCEFDGDTITYNRVAPFTPDETLAGIYRSNEADATYQVRFEGNDLWIDNKPFPSIKLSPSFKNGYFSDGGDLFEFIKSKKGKFIRLEVSTSRAERVIFIKD